MKHLPPACLLLSLSALSVPTDAVIRANQEPQARSGQAGDLADTPVRLTAEQARNFRRAFQAIAEKARVCILAEDAPFQMELSEGQASDLIESTAPSAESLIGRVAAAYDYTVEHPGRRGSKAHPVFLLRKRFTQQNDLPDVTFDECRLAFSQIARFFAPFQPQPPTTSNTNTVLDIADALSQQQIRQMADGGIPIRSLSPAQRRMVWRLALHMYVRLNSGYVAEAGQYLDKVQKQGAVKRGFVPEGHPYYSVWQGKEAYGVGLPATDAVQQFTPCCPVSEDANLNSPGITVKTEDFLGKIGEAKPAPGTETLKAVVADLSRRAPASKFSLDPAVAARRVSRFGAAHAPPEAQIEALAALLDLRFLHRTEDTFGLARPDVPQPRDVTELFASVRVAVPAPIRRYVGVALPAPPADVTGPLPNWEDIARRDRASAGGGVARFQMRPALVAALQGDEGKRVPFASLDERTRSRFAFYWLQETLIPRLLGLPTRTPEYISRFPDAVLKGGWSGEGENQKFEATIVFNLPSGGASYAGFTVGARRFPEKVRP